LENYIIAEFKLRMRDFFLCGYEKGYGQDRIIKAFLLHYSIKNNIVNYDAVKKMDYRNRMKITEEVEQGIQLSFNF